MEAPFSDKEKRFILSEAIKTSSVPIDKLWTFVMESEIQPEWQEALMPYGRNLSSCVKVWESLRHGSVAASANITLTGPDRKRKSIPEATDQFQSIPQPKRRPPGPDNMIRIRPKPVSDNSPTSSSITVAAMPKKRGRPSKAVVEARNAAAVARGEVILTPRLTMPRDSYGSIGSAESANSPSSTRMAPYAPTYRHEPLPAPSYHANAWETVVNRPIAQGSSSSMDRSAAPGTRLQAESTPRDEGRSGTTFSYFSRGTPQLRVPSPPAVSPRTEEAPRKPISSGQDGGIAAPVYPAIDALLSPEPPRPGTSSRSN